MGVNDYGAATSPLDAPPLGGPGGWAESVSAVLDGSDETVDSRIAVATADLGARITRPNIDDRLVEQWNGSAWSVVDYDSGLRDVSADLLNGWDIAAPDATEHCYMRRVNSEVRLYWYSFTMGETAPNTNIYDIPDGFNAPTYYKDLRAFAVGISNSNYLIMQINPGRINVRAATGSVLNWELCWAVDVSIPTSLPGTLVSPAPQ